MIQIGQIWNVYVPFANEPESGKFRPAAIVGWSKFGLHQDELIWVVPITAHSDGGTSLIGEVLIEKFQNFGLPRKSWVRPRALYAVDKRIFPKDQPTLGTLDLNIMIEIYEEMGRMNHSNNEIVVL